MDTDARKRRRAEMRAKHPDLAAFIDSLLAVGIGVHAVTVEGVRYGPPPLPDRRTGPVPPIPGVPR